MATENALKTAHFLQFYKIHKSTGIVTRLYTTSAQQLQQMENQTPIMTEAIKPKTTHYHLMPTQKYLYNVELSSN